MQVQSRSVLSLAGLAWWCLLLLHQLLAQGAHAYDVKVRVVDRMLTGKPLVENASLTNPYSKNACGGKACTNVLNPAWIPFGNDDSPTKHRGGLFIRLSTPLCKPSVISLLTAKPDGSGLHFDAPSDDNVLRDGPKGTDQEVAFAIDPRAIHRPLTNEYFVFYQTLWNRTRRTQISSTKSPDVLSSWKRFENSMFDIDDCGTTLWFPEDDDPSIPVEEKKAYAIATFGALRGGNLTLMTSSDGMKTWVNHSTLLLTRPGKWDNATLSSGPPPQRLSNGDWFMLYNVDNKWPVGAPKPFPKFGRCALGWAILDGKDITNVVARAEEPLVFAEYPWETNGTTNMVVYTDGIRPEGKDTFTVFAGGADTVIEAFTIQVQV
jgi:predicted GH43/DUF377 family glycosyl hydrolase